MKTVKSVKLKKFVLFSILLSVTILMGGESAQISKNPKIETEKESEQNIFEINVFPLNSQNSKTESSEIIAKEIEQTNSLPEKTVYKKEIILSPREENTSVESGFINEGSEKKSKVSLVPTASDLQISAIALSKDPCKMNEIETITLTVNEVGGSSVSNRKIQYYLSTNTTITTSDYYIGDDYVSLSAYGQGTETISFRPNSVSGLTKGDYYVGIIIPDENQYYWRNDLLTIQDAAEAEVYHISVNPNPCKMNKSCSITVNVREIQGGSVSNLKMTYHLTNDSNHSITYEIGSDYINLSAYGSGTESLSFVPESISSLTPGRYWLTIRILDQLASWNYTTPLDIESAVYADLEIPGISFSQNPCPMNVNETITLDVREVGGESVSNREIKYYLSTDTDITTSDYYIGNDYVTLSANGSGSENIAFKPENITGLTTGDYYVGVMIPDEGNRWWRTDPVTITSPIYTDLELTGIAATLNPCSLNESETITISIREAGGVAVANRRIQYYLSTDNVITTSDFYLGDDQVTLSANASGTEDITFVPEDISGLSAGNYYIGITIPDEGEYWVTNTQLTLTQVNGELNITSISADNNPTNMDETITITVITNEVAGGMLSNLEIEYYLSSNSTINSSDYKIGNDNVTLSENGSGSETITFKPQDVNGINIGEYYIGVNVPSQSQYWCSNYKLYIQAIGTSITKIPSEYNLSQNYPNPFNPSTTISYDLPEHSDVTLKVFDLNSKEVFSMEDELDAGHYELKFDPSVHGLSTGIYIYTLKAGDFVETRKMVYMK